ncbi:MAG: bacitracin ABC transporter ATP-binding protein, partial [Microcystis sp. M53599_WE4]|nr:bacitracin ABC transporter ATP-binding protein [Microcystis sp. M53599_WE4]
MVVVGKAHLRINLGRIMQTFTDKTVNSSTTTQPFLLVSNVAKEYP